ncbi:MAG: hypothetical protein AAF585_02315, partial [Verrucomicrobiota bacterium]
GGKGESKGITPYGLDYSPVDGKIWYSKLNVNRIGRIDPKVPDGDITEWNPPFRGPRRLHVAPDGVVWVPGFGSGVFGGFDPKTEEWKVYPLPNYENQIPYALNVAPDGMVWVCGTGNDTLYRFNPETEYLVEFRLPTQVSYTREIEFDAEGNVWTSTSGPARHMENRVGEIIKLEILDKDEKEMGGVKLATIELSLDEQGILTEAQEQKQLQERIEQLGSLFAKIEARKLPEDYDPKAHQQYVDRVMESMPEHQRNRVGQLYNDRRQSGAKMENPGHTFVRILDYVANGGTATEIPAEPGPGTNSGPMEEQAAAQLIQSGKFDSAPFEAVDVALKQTDRGTRGAALSAAFGRLGSGVGGTELDAVVKRVESLADARDKDFAINGLAHGLVSKDSEAALKWANSISDEGFRKTVLANVTRRIESQPPRPGKGKGGKSAAAGSKSMETKTGVHRLDSPKRAPFDAFVYVNRIPDKPREGESPTEFTGRIQGRLANQEGRIQIKLPPGMDDKAYLGFKTFINSEAAAWSEASLSDSKARKAKIQNVIEEKTAASQAKSEAENLLAFLRCLDEVKDEEFRSSIIEAEVLDTTKDIAPAPEPSETAPALRGAVRFEGPAPERKPVPMDTPSRKLHDKQPLDESILVSESGGLANVFVYVKNPPDGDYPTPAEPAIIDQQGSIFHPRVQGLRVGQQLLMKNGDPFIHNIRSLSRKNRPFNIAQPAGSDDRETTFEHAEGPITIKCDFHRWMEAQFWVMDHPFYAVTDAEGKFEIPGLPPGEYTLVAWHERLGEQSVKSRESGITFTFRPEN